MKVAFFSLFAIAFGLPLVQGTIQQTTLVGGLDHGTQFSDLSIVTASESSAILASITIRGGSRVDGISYTYAWNGIPAISHGGTGGTAYSLALAYGEDITTVKACADRYRPNIVTAYHTRIFYLSITTTLGYGVTAGSISGTCTTWTAPAGMGLIGFEGRDGDEIDAIAPIWGTPSAYL
ncbi:hypothetical protein B0O99DRAFT_696443 [Bisporella sp. PMI_857]|nr:hypothetical protein B0O99DRAFT_696443 [Bisporella sp. PMI_857]